MKTKSAISFLAISALLLAGCADASPSGGPSGSETPTEEPKVYVTAPLTGITFEEGAAGTESLSLPAVACKVDNVEAARPQYNLNKTDIVFVEMVEFGLTRLVAVWHSTPVDAAGPVRSVRPMDADITAPLAGIFCYSGGQAPFVNAVKETGQYMASETSEQGNKKGSFSRSSDKPAPHNVIVNIDLLQSQHPELAAPPAMLPMVAFDPETESYEAPATEAGLETLSFKVTYPSAVSSWKADASGYWVRSQDGAKHMDKASGEQIRATNVVVLKTKIDGSFIDKKYGVIPRTVMIDSGMAWIFHNGKRIKGTWSKASQTSPIQLFDEAGNPIYLATGNTWIELMTTSAKIEIKSPELPSPSPSASSDD